MKTGLSGIFRCHLFARRVLYFSADTAGKGCPEYFAVIFLLVVSCTLAPIQQARSGKLGAGAFEMVACAVE